MKALLNFVSSFLIILMVFILVAGLIFLFSGNDSLSSFMFLIASLMLPLIMSVKFVEFMIDNQQHKMLLSVFFLLLVCVLSILFAFS